MTRYGSQIRPDVTFGVACSNLDELASYCEADVVIVVRRCPEMIVHKGRTRFHLARYRHSRIWLLEAENGVHGRRDIAFTSA